MLTGRSYRKPGHNLIQQMGGGFQTPIATASAGASVQHGLSAAGGVYGFYQHCSAADKRIIVRLLQEPLRTSPTSWKC